MDKPGFIEYLKERGFGQELIDQHLDIVGQLNTYLQGNSSVATIDNASKEAMREYIDRLIETGGNTEENLTAICRYAHHAGNDPVFVEVFALLDGAEAFKNMYERLEAEVGVETRDAIYAGITMPPLGCTNFEKARLNQLVIERFEERIDVGDCRRILSACMRDLPMDWYKADKEKFFELADIDEFLKFKKEAFIGQLEMIRQAGGLFFGQPVTEAVIEYVKSDDEISVGKRVGSVLYVTKIPYMTKSYLEETDPVLKRYHYCHCPWARESIMDGMKTVSQTWCYCSGGFHKKLWETIYDRELKVELLESVLGGDERCRFAIHLPAELMPD